MTTEGPASESRMWGIPRLPEGWVDRPRLTATLAVDPLPDVMLLCAPPGSGKTVLASTWARSYGRTHPVAWIDCRGVGTNHSRFWSGFFRALHDGLGEGWERKSQTGSGSSALASDREELLDTVVDRLRQLPEGTVLVLDDFQDVSGANLHSEVQYVVEHLPLSVSVMVLSRTYPPLALHRANLEGRLRELRGAELAFNREEASQLLDHHGVRVGDEDLDVLLDRTHGWAAGLRLALITLDHSPDSAQVIRHLAGTTQSLSGYFIEQVLSRLSRADRLFLFRTCIVNELTLPLARALSGTDVGLLDLQNFARRIGFLSQTDGPEPTFTYHPMFAELVRALIHNNSESALHEAHRRAARYFERAGKLAAAIRHAQSGADWDLAARVLLVGSVSLLLHARMSDLATFVEAFPSDVAATDPRILAVKAMTVLYEESDPNRATELLQRARAELPSTGDLYERRTAAVVSYAEGLLARYQGDTEGALVVMTDQGPDIPRRDDPDFTTVDMDLRGAWWSARAAALLWDDQLGLAREAATLARDELLPSAVRWPLMTSMGVLAFADALDGHLNSAQTSLDDLTLFVDLRDLSEAPYAGYADFALAWIAMERAEFAAADDALKRAERRWERVPSRPSGVTATLLRARLELVAGEGPKRARHLLASAFARGPTTHSRLLDRLVATISVECALTEGRFEQAESESRAGPMALRSYVAARAGATPMASNGTDDGLHLRIVLAQALTSYRGQRIGEADEILDGALETASRERFRLPFLQLGETGRQMLTDCPVSSLRHGRFLAELLNATAPAMGRSGADLIDPLTPRELEVLRHLVSGLDVDDIAGTLFLSRNTVRTHVKSIYRKLFVSSKRDAILRSRSLGLI